MASKIPISTGGWCNPPSQREADGKGRAKLVLCVKENLLGVVPEFLLLSRFEDVQGGFPRFWRTSGLHGPPGMSWFALKDLLVRSEQVSLSQCDGDISFLGDSFAVPLWRIHAGHTCCLLCPGHAACAILRHFWDVKGPLTASALLKTGIGWIPADFLSWWCGRIIRKGDKPRLSLIVGSEKIP